MGICWKNSFSSVVSKMVTHSHRVWWLKELAMLLIRKLLGVLFVYIIHMDNIMYLFYFEESQMIFANFCPVDTYLHYHLLVQILKNLIL